MTNIRDPIDFMDCLTVLRNNGCELCSFRPRKLGTYESCTKRIALKNRYIDGEK